ncbi:MAG: phosphatidate cytidylyltransferase [Muribaculaceae bacterium]|nr:phosphatidate cytidylyltransferase [Muribaculaceae bacterium]
MSNMNPVLTRSLSGIIYVAVIVGACMCGEYGVIALCILFGVLGVIEFKHMYSDQQQSPLWLTIYDIISVCSLAIPFIGVLIALTLLLGRMIIMIYDTDNKAISSYALDVMMYLYIGCPIVAMTMLGIHNSLIVLATFIMIWLNDTGAYCVGTLFGKHKMFPRVSPKKSWEGFFGGMLFCVAFGVILGLSNWTLAEIRLPGKLYFWIIVSVFTCILSTYGDLFESRLKRQLNLKDSGHLIPGHGGILDRIDSMLMVMPTILIIFLLWMMIY